MKYDAFVEEFQDETALASSDEDIETPERRSLKLKESQSRTGHPDDWTESEWFKTWSTLSLHNNSAPEGTGFS